MSKIPSVNSCLNILEDMINRKIPEKDVSDKKFSYLPAQRMSEKHQIEPEQESVTLDSKDSNVDDHSNALI